MTANDSAARAGTEVVVAFHTGLTFVAVTGMPAQTNTVTDLQFFHMRAHRADAPRHFMARHKGITGHAPFVIQHAQIAVADAAVFHIDFHIMVTQRARIVFKRLEFTTRFEGCVGFDHGCSPDIKNGLSGYT